MVLPKGTRLNQTAATEIVAHLKQSLSDNSNFSPDFSLMQNTLLNEIAQQARLERHKPGTRVPPEVLVTP